MEKLKMKLLSKVSKITFKTLDGKLNLLYTLAPMLHIILSWLTNINDQAKLIKFT